MDLSTPAPSTVLQSRRLCTQEDLPSRKRQKIDHWVGDVVLPTRQQGRRDRAQSDTRYEVVKAFDRRTVTSTSPIQRLTARALVYNQLKCTYEFSMGHTEESSVSLKASTIKPIDPDYESCLMARGIFLPDDVVPGPSNLEEIQETLENPRGSPGPSDTVAKGFGKLFRTATSEGDMMQVPVLDLVPLLVSFWRNNTDKVPVNEQ